MDEESYKIARADIAPVPCVFEKSILASRVCCSHASRKNLADREVVRCQSQTYQSWCSSWLKLLRQKSLFALQLSGISDDSIALPHTKEMKVQVGGLNGLASLLALENQLLPPGDSSPHDVFFTLTTCCKKPEEFEQLPFDEIVKSVASYRVR